MKIEIKGNVAECEDCSGTISVGPDETGKLICNDCIDANYGHEDIRGLMAEIRISRGMLDQTPKDNSKKPRGMVRQLILKAITDRWLSVDQIAEEVGSDAKTVRGNLYSKEIYPNVESERRGNRMHFKIGI